MVVKNLFFQYPIIKGRYLKKKKSAKRGGLGSEPGNSSQKEAGGH